MRIFISYRRQDSGAVAGRVRDRLALRFGDDAVFMDVEHIPFGQDFRKFVKDEIERTDVVLAVVGPHWCKDSSGINRLDESNDPVRIEIEAALQMGKTVIPVLVDDAKMPGEQDLPPSLKEFIWLNG